MSVSATLPPQLAELAQEFKDTGPSERLLLLVELAAELPELPAPDDFYVQLGLADAVSPLRLRGAAAMLARIKRAVREQVRVRP